MGKGAQKGDTVRVGFANNPEFIEGKVIYTPCAQVDSWVIVTEHGVIHHVQMFETITVMNREAKTE